MAFFSLVSVVTVLMVSHFIHQCCHYLKLKLTFLCYHFSRKFFSYFSFDWKFFLNFCFSLVTRFSHLGFSYNDAVQVSAQLLRVRLSGMYGT